MKDLTIASVEALPCSVPLKQPVTRGLGSVSKRRVLANHGACVRAMSGVDLALWDVKGKALGQPLYRLLGGASRPVPAYAGGFALGYAAPAPAAVADEAMGQVAAGYRAVKLRLGDTLNHDMERSRALRSALGPDVTLLADANCRYSVDDVRAMLPVLAEAGAGWLEEPFPPYQDRSWRTAAALAGPVLPLAAGENLYTRYEFQRLVDGGTASVVQPDLSRCGGASIGGAPSCCYLI